MKRLISHIVFFMLLGIFSGCGNKPSSQHSNNDSTENLVQNNIDEPVKDEVDDDQNKSLKESGQTLSLPDTHYVHIDTMLHIENCNVVLTKEKFDASQKKYSADDVFYNSFTLYIQQSNGDSILFKKLLDENQFISQRSFKEKQTHYIILSSFSGGSGYVCTVYKLNIGKTNTMQSVFQYSELTSTLFSSDGSQVLIMQGIWDMRDESDESHFSDHKYEIQTVDLNHPEFKRETIGYTVHKYPSADYDFSAEKLLKQIHQKEPQVFKNLKMDKYLIQ